MLGGGGGGAVADGFRSARPKWSLVRGVGAAHAEFTADAHELRFRLVGANGAVRDSFVLRKP